MKSEHLKKYHFKCSIDIGVLGNGESGAHQNPTVEVVNIKNMFCCNIVLKIFKQQENYNKYLNKSNLIPIEKHTLI